MGFIFILAQILALVACGLNVISMQCKTRKKYTSIFLVRKYCGCDRIVAFKSICWSINIICVWNSNIN